MRGSVVSQTAVDLIDEFSRTAADDPARPGRRERAIEAWLPLAQHLARRYHGRGEPLGDLVQVATVGLIKAVDRFEPERGMDFGAFAVPTVLGEIKRHFRDRTWMIRVPRRLQELRLDITAATNELTHTLDRSPTVADIAAHLKVTEDEVIEGLEGARAYAATSLSAPAGEDGSAELADTLGAVDDGFELAELRVALGPAMTILDERERRILAMRFYGNQTQQEIAGQIGISQMHVSRLISRALAKLRTQLES